MGDQLFATILALLCQESSHPFGHPFGNSAAMGDQHFDFVFSYLFSLPRELTSDKEGVCVCWRRFVVVERERLIDFQDSFEDE